MAAWIATEFWSEFHGKVAIALTPVADGRLEVELDGQELFSRKVAGVYPSRDHVEQMKEALKVVLAATARA